MHLLFTDSILFYDATEVNFHAVRNIWETYERGSRLMINMDKSIFTFSSKVGDEKVAELADCLGIGFTKELETYLELPTLEGMRKRKAFSVIKTESRNNSSHDARNFSPRMVGKSSLKRWLTLSTIDKFYAPLQAPNNFDQ